MSDILVAVITGVLALLGTALGTASGIKTNQKVTDYKIEELTREVREHNNFARRMPVVEDRIKAINHRIAELEANITRLEERINEV